MNYIRFIGVAAVLFSAIMIGVMPPKDFWIRAIVVQSLAMVALSVFLGSQTSMVLHLNVYLLGIGILLTAATILYILLVAGKDGEEETKQLKLTHHRQAFALALIAPVSMYIATKVGILILVATPSWGYVGPPYAAEYAAAGAVTVTILVLFTYGLRRLWLSFMADPVG